jgi:hypothetical protein
MFDLFDNPLKNNSRFRYTKTELQNMLTFISHNKNIEDNDYMINKCPIILPEALNNMQLFAFNILNDQLEKKEPLRMIIKGGGGVGKSYLVHAISTYLNDKVKRATPTASSALLIQGETYHSLFNISGLEYHTLPIERLKNAQQEFEKITTVILDEYGMIGQLHFGFLDRRLREISGRHDAIMGGYTVLLFGDIYQIPPVLQNLLYDTKLKTIHDVTGYEAFLSFDVVVELTENMRQQKNMDLDQNKFIDLLPRFKLGDCSIEDWKFLNDRKVSLDNYAKFETSTRIFSKVVETVRHNFIKLNNLKTPIVKLQSGNMPPEAKNLDDEMFNGMPNTSYIAINANIIYLFNTWKKASLVNGAKGIVKDIIYPENCSEHSQPEILIICFDKWNGPQFFKDNERKNWIPIIKISQYNYKYRMTRSGFPIMLGYAVTAHRVQGLTLDTGVIDFGKSEFALGISYVALSRFKSINNLLINGHSYDRITTQIKKHAQYSKREQEEQRLQTLKMKTFKRFDYLLCSDLQTCSSKITSDNSCINTTTLIGLKNLGHTCYLNSLIQCFAQNKIINKYFLLDTNIKIIKNKNNIYIDNRSSFIELLQNVIYKCKNSFCEIKDLSFLFNKLLEYEPKFGSANTNNDAVELFDSFLQIFKQEHCLYYNNGRKFLQNLISEFQVC